MPQESFPWTPPQAATTTVVGGVLKAATQAANAAVIPSAAPAGGTGAAAGGWDTAPHRDAAIATINALVTAVDSLKTDYNALLAKLVAAGVVAAA